MTVILYTKHAAHCYWIDVKKKNSICTAVVAPIEKEKKVFFCVCELHITWINLTVLCIEIKALFPFTIVVWYTNVFTQSTQSCMMTLHRSEYFILLLSFFFIWKTLRLWLIFSSISCWWMPWKFSSKLYNFKIFHSPSFSSYRITSMMSEDRRLYRFRKL